MKIAYITHTDENTRWYSDTVVQFTKEYCNRHNYKFIEYKNRTDYKPHRHSTWIKLYLILETLEAEDADYIFWCDADACPVDMRIPLDIYIKDTTKDIIIDTQPKGFHITGKTSYMHAENTGMWFIKNTEWSRKFIRYLIDSPKFKEFYYMLYHEQSAFTIAREQCLEFEAEKHIELLPPYTMYSRCSFDKHFIHTFGNVKPLLLSVDKFIKR